MTCRLLIQGATFENKGAEAMIRCVQQGIIANLPGARGLLEMRPRMNWSPEELRGLEPWACLAAGGRSKRLAATVMDGMLRLLPEPTRARCTGALMRVNLGIDAVIDIAGYGAGDAWAKTGLRGKIARALADDVRLLAACDVPFIYLPQCWGPFERRESREMAERRLKNALHLYARDLESLNWLRTLPSFSEERVSLASDIAFTFEGASRQVGRELLGEIGIRLNDAPILGIVPNMRVYERARGEGADCDYVGRLVEVARHFAGRLGCQVAVMPHEIKLRSDTVPDDRYLCELIADGASGLGNVCAACRNYSSEQLKAMIGELELLVSSRFHSIIAAMSQRIPVVSVSWSHKYSELMESVGLGDYVVEYDRLEGASFVELCEQAWRRRARMTASLEEHVPEHEASARRALSDSVTRLRERALS